jgi:hypothetical protein
MPRHFQADIHPLRPQTAPLPIGPRSVADVPAIALPPRFARAEPFVTQPLTKVPTVAQYDWLPNAAPNAIALPHVPGDLFAAPAKFNISAPAAVSLAAFLGELAGPAKEFVFIQAEPFTAPGKALPPAAITLNHWLPNAAPNAVALPHIPGDLFAAPAKFNISAPAAVSLAAFLGELAGPAKEFIFIQAEPFTAPGKALPPAPITLNHWLPNLAPDAITLTYAPTPAFSAPDKFGIAVPAPPVLAGFLGEVAGTAKEFVFIQAEPFTAPGKVLALIIVPLGWQTTTAPAAVQKSATRAPASAAPEKITVAIAPNTLDKWSQLEPPARYIARFARALELSGPDKTLPSLITNPLCAQSGSVRMSLEAQIALVRLALGSQSGRVRQALLAQGARAVMC